MTGTSDPHFLHYLFADMRARADDPLLCEHQGAIFRTATHREATKRIADFSRALFTTPLEPGDRITLHAAASPSLLIGEWGVLACRGIAVIVPRNFTAAELTDTLIETKSKLVIVDRLATAHHLAQNALQLPDLKAIVCFEGGAAAAIPITQWNVFIDSGAREADRSTALMRNIASKDTALLFYYRDESGARKAVRYTHGLLLDHAARISSMLGEQDIRKGELALSATGWEHAIGHIAACYLPVLKEAAVQITYGTPHTGLFDNAPHVTVGDAVFFDGIRQNILQQVRSAGQLETMLLNKALTLSKQGYESKKNGLFSRILRSIVKATVIKKVQKMLGGRMRLFIGTDDGAHYDMQLFFHTFGIELIELPQEVFKQD